MILSYLWYALECPFLVRGRAVLTLPSTGSCIKAAKYHTRRFSTALCLLAGKFCTKRATSMLIVGRISLRRQDHYAKKSARLPRTTMNAGGKSASRNASMPTRRLTRMSRRLSRPRTTPRTIPMEHRHNQPRRLRKRARNVAICTLHPAAPNLSSWTGDYVSICHTRTFPRREHSYTGYTQNVSLRFFNWAVSVTCQVGGCRLTCVPVGTTCPHRYVRMRRRRNKAATPFVGGE